MLTGTQDVDPVALYTADELYDLDDEAVLARRRVSPAVYQELQARVLRQHRAFAGLVRTRHPGTGEVVDAVSVRLRAQREGSDTVADMRLLAAALESTAQRFLGDRVPGGDGLAEVWTPSGELHAVEFRGGDEGASRARCWQGGEVVGEGTLVEVLCTILDGSPTT